VGTHLRFICLGRRNEAQWSVVLPIVQRVLFKQHPTNRFGSGASQNCHRRFSDHGQALWHMIPDPITGKVQLEQGLAAIHSTKELCTERKKVVQEHPIDTQASIIKSAQEYQQKHIRSRAARHNKTPLVPLDAY
jgi:hypothetical protein